MTLEIDPREASGKIYAGQPEEKIFHGDQYSPSTLSLRERWQSNAQTDDEDISRLKVRTFRLIVALVVALGAIIASAVTGGVLASRHHNTIVSLRSQLAQAMSTTADSVRAANNSRPSSALDDTNLPATVHPVTNCSRLPSPFASDQEGTQFTLYCGTDSPGNALLGIYVYTFQDCINACADYNRDEDGGRSQECDSASYSPLHEWEYKNQNCWLRYHDGQIHFIKDDTTDIAVSLKS